MKGILLLLLLLLLLMVTSHVVLCSTNVNFQSVFPLALNVCHYKTIRINSPQNLQVSYRNHTLCKCTKSFSIYQHACLWSSIKTHYFSYLFNCLFSRRWEESNVPRPCICTPVNECCLTGVPTYIQHTEYTHINGTVHSMELLTIRVTSQKKK
jgi:hypothetical protein